MQSGQVEAIRELFKMVSKMGKTAYFYLSESLENLDYRPDPACPDVIRTCILDFLAGDYLPRMACGEHVHYILDFGVHFQVVHLPDGDGFLVKGPFRYQEPAAAELEQYIKRHSLPFHYWDLLKAYLAGITDAHASTQPFFYVCKFILDKGNIRDFRDGQKVYLTEPPRAPARQLALDLDNTPFYDEKYARELELQSLVSQGKRREAGTLLQSWIDTQYIGQREMFVRQQDLNAGLQLIELNVLCKQALQHAKIPTAYVEKAYATVIQDISTHTQDIGQHKNQYSARILDLYCKLAEDYATQGYSKPVKQAVDYILLNYKEKITLKRMAGYTALSPSYLSSLFHKETGDPITVYINKIRVQSSLTLLANTDLPVGQVAERVGFDDGNYFSRLFRKYMHSTPLEYRKNYRTVAATLDKDWAAKS